MKYSIEKIYEGAESRNKKDQDGLPLDQAITWLDITQNLWAKSGVIIERTEHSLTVEEANGEGRITFKIVEQED